jgi:hypothetical protein
MGDTSASVGNVAISNVNGAYSSAGATTNVVHVCGPNNNQPTKNPCSASTNQVTVSDVVISGVSDVNGSCTTAVQDDVTGSSIAPQTLNYNASATLPLGIYILGEEIGGTGAPGGYSRFSTSPSTFVLEEGTLCGNKYETQTTNVPVWGVGKAAPNLGGSGSCFTPGALYSNVQGQAGSTLYVCTIALTWKAVI